jgi:hypothetical protein
VHLPQWKRPITITALVAAAALMAGCTVVGGKVVSDENTTIAAPTPAALREKVGVSAGSATIWADDATRRQALKAIADTGAHWVAMDMDWNSINGAGPNVWRWDATDLFVREARSYGLAIVAIAGYSPRWAEPASCPASALTHCLPASPETYAAFAHQVAARYGSLSPIPDLRNSIEAWQVWNEPNHVPFVQPTVDVRQYTAILKRAYVEFKAADPAATVIAGGTSPAPDAANGTDMAPLTFLKGIYNNGGQGFFDAFGHHPYSFPCSPLIDASWSAFTQTRFLHDLMAKNGDGAKKIWATESGAPTASNVASGCNAGPNSSVTEAQQAQFVADYLKGWTQKFGSFTGPLIWFQIRDNGPNRADRDDNFGLVHQDFTPKPAWTKLQQLLAG